MAKIWNFMKKGDSKKKSPDKKSDNKKRSRTAEPDQNMVEEMIAKSSKKK